MRSAAEAARAIQSALLQLRCGFGNQNVSSNMGSLRLLDGLILPKEVDGGPYACTRLLRCKRSV